MSLFLTDDVAISVDIKKRDCHPIITCEVNLKPKNDESLLFHKKYGFEQVGTQETDGGKKEVSLMVYKIPL